MVVLLLAVALVGIGWYAGRPVVLAASMHWLLLSAFAAGSLYSRAPTEEPARNLPAARMVAGLLVPSVALSSYVLVQQGVAASSAPASAFDPAGFLLLATAIGSGALAWFCRGLHPQACRTRWSVHHQSCGCLAGVGGSRHDAGSARRPGWSRRRSPSLLAVPSALALELLLAGVVAVFRPGVGAPFGADLVIARFLGSAYNPVQRRRRHRHHLRRGHAARGCFLPPAGLPADGHGLRDGRVAVGDRRCGCLPGGRPRAARPGGSATRPWPGLVVGLPWPFDRVRRVEMSSGFAACPWGTEPKAGADALWTQYHAAEEYNLLLGNGRDLVTVNAEVLYRINDVHSWLYRCQNPEQALQTLSYRALMDATVDKTLDEVLSRDIASFSARMHQRIQDEADQEELGVEVVAFNLRGLHPPVAVAEQYQAVVAAQLDRTTSIMGAELYRQVALPMAQAVALSKEHEASAARASRLAKANGEATAFNTLVAQYRVSPRLYRFRKRLETLETVLENESYYLLDARIEQDGGAVWILK